MQGRWATTLLGAVVVAFGTWLAVRDFANRQPAPASHHVADDAGDDGGGLVFALVDAGPLDAAAPLLLSDYAVVEPRVADAGGATLFDGSPVPPLPLNAPRQVRFGVVLVSYAGAQPSANGGRPATRSRSDARELATKLAATASHDFHAAVQQGDAGSADDLGTVRLGVLEPAPEYVLFTLPVDGVGGPVDTPRGYWIVKRLE